MPTNEFIIRLFKKYSLGFMILGVAFWGLYKFVEVTPEDIIPTCSLGDLKVGALVDYSGSDAYVTQNNNYGGSVWIRAQVI